MTDLQYLTDRAEIADAVSALAHAQDDRNWTALRQVFTEKVQFDLSRHLDLPAADLTADELVDMTRAALSGFTSTQHANSNVLITVTGDSARCRANITAYHHLATEPGVADFCTMRGRWDLALQRVDGRWLVCGVTVVRTSPFEGYAGLYRLAAEASAKDGTAGASGAK